MNSSVTRPVISVLLVCAVGAAFFLLRPVLVPVVLACVAALLAHPLYERVCRKFRMNESVGSLVILLASLVFVCVPLVIGGMYVWSEFLTVYGKAYAMVHAAGLDDLSSSELWHDIQTVLRQYHVDDQAFLRTVLFPVLNTVNTGISNFFSNFLGGAIHVVIGLFVFLVTFFFFVRDGRKLVSLLERLSPLSEQETRHVFQTFTYVIEGLLIGNFLTAIAQGVIGGIGFWLFGLPAPAFWGTVMMVASLFPFVGPALVYAPATLFVYVSSGKIAIALLYLAYNLLVTSSMDNIIKPIVMGRHTDIHPVIMFLALIAGVTLWGPIGIIYGPIIAALLLLAIDFYLEETKQRSLFPGV